MEAGPQQLPPPALAPTAPPAAALVAVRLFHRQRALGYLLASFVGSGLLACALTQVPGNVSYLAYLGAVLFLALPLALNYAWRAAYIKPALLSLTPWGLCLEASDTHYQVAWADLATYQAEFMLGNLVGDGYRLKLWDAQGYSVVLNLLENNILPDSADGLRPNSALAYLARYIGWHNRLAAGNAPKIVFRPTLLARKTGTVLLVGLGTLLLLGLGMHWLHPHDKGVTPALLAGAVVLPIKLLSIKERDDRYNRYLHNLEEGIEAE